MDKPMVLDLDSYFDLRGYMSVLFDASVCEQLDFTIKQVNQGYSEKAYTLRGLHFQSAPYGQAKLVQALRGAICNVAVDIRSTSSNFGRAYCTVLQADDHRAIYIPKGFAHGYLTLEPDTLMQWCVDADFHGESARCLRFDDPNIIGANGTRGIEWPGNISDFIVSDKDRHGLSLSELLLGK